MPESDSICHGDFTPSNVVMDADGTVSILDWSHATRGNAAADAAITCLKLLSRKDTEGAEGAELYLKDFCMASGSERGEIKRWLPIVAAAHLAHCKEQEREFLSRLAEAEPSALPL